MAMERYYRPGVDMICLTMDVEEYMTSLRAIPHVKRGRNNNIEAEIEYGKLSNVRKGSGVLTPHGDRSDLLTRGNSRFTQLLFDTICNQAKEADSGEWTPHRYYNKFAFVVIGGSVQACVATGKGQVRMNSYSMTVSSQHIENAMEKIKVIA